MPASRAEWRQTVEAYKRAVKDSFREMKQKFPSDAAELTKFENSTNLDHGVSSWRYDSSKLSKDCAVAMREVKTIAQNRDRVRNAMDRNIETVVGKGYGKPVNIDGKEWTCVGYGKAPKGQKPDAFEFKGPNGDRKYLSSEEVYDILKQNGRIPDEASRAA